MCGEPLSVGNEIFARALNYERLDERTGVFVSGDPWELLV